jgi:hypothetical protein
MLRRLTVILLVCAYPAVTFAAEAPQPVKDGSWVALIVRKATTELEKKLGIVFEGKVGVFLCGSKEEMDRVTGGRLPYWALAVASPKQRVIAINSRKLAIATGNDIGVAIRHEMVHIILGQLPSRSPRWFEEGVAELLSGRPVPAVTPELRMAAKGGGLIPLSDLADDWPKGSVRASLAYSQGVSAVAYLTMEYGEDSLSKVVRGLSRGDDFESALESAVGTDVAAFEREWVGSLKGAGFGLTVLALLLRPPYIYTAMSVLAILVAAVVLIKRRLAMKRMEEEEPWS